MKQHCPLCNLVLVPTILIADKDTFKERILTLSDNRLNILQSALIKYWRWMAEGQKKYYDLYDQGSNYQHYYDPDRESISFDPLTNRYSFSIYTLGLSDGDIWWKGSFRLKYLTGIEDLIYDEEKI